MVRPAYMLQFYKYSQQFSESNQILQANFSCSLAGHHDSAITLPNRFPVQNAKPGTIYICWKKIQFCCKLPPHHGPRTLLSSKSPNYQFILPFPSPAAQDRSLRLWLPSPDQTHSLSPLTVFACLDHLKGFCLQKVFSLPDCRHKKFHPSTGSLGG